jgi:outer membrane protein OmpA-like peptidoglycan-associated protein
MKKIILSIITLIVCTISYGQNDYKKLPSLGVHLFFNDFQTASDLRSIGLANVIRDKQWTKSNRMTAGIAISYVQGLSNKFDFSATLSGSFGEYPVPNKVRDNAGRLILEGVAAGNLKLLSDNYLFNPYISAGLGASKYKVYYSAFIPVGVGLQVRLVEDIFLVGNAQYRIPVTENAAYHLYYSMGIVAPLKKRPEPKVVEVAPPVVVVLDRDGDGVVDADDKCPDTPGLASLQGCPDRDADGIADADDACPDKAGLAKYKGCPIPDTDGDGINDEMDKCPTVAGVARYQGCPVPDSDADGVNDEEDKCPNRAGPASNQGCPEITKEVIEKINFAAKNIFFATGSFKLLPKSFKSLDEVASILKADDLLKIQIDGHTDAQGDDAKNMTLSENRAKAVKDYLVSKGVTEASTSSAGFGETKPVADNKTAAGRAKNRRVEMTVRNF